MPETDFNRLSWVAPLAGAWIEITKIAYLYLCIWSLPSRGRGLKYLTAYLS